jgi:hypothetical protein
MGLAAGNISSDYIARIGRKRGGHTRLSAQTKSQWTLRCKQQ